VAQLVQQRNIGSPQLNVYRTVGREGREKWQRLRLGTDALEENLHNCSTS